MSLVAKYLASSGVATPEKWLVQFFGGGGGSSGMVVNAGTAQRLTAVTCALRILSETEAVLPLPVYRRLKGGGKERARELRLYRLLNNQANPWQTGFEFRRMMTWHAAARGVAYAQIVQRRDGEIEALIPLATDRLRPDINDQDEIVFRYQPLRGAARTFRYEEVFKLLMFSEDGVTSRSLIETCQEAVGVGMAAEEFAARFYANNATPGGLIKSKSRLGAEAQKRLKEEWAARYSGAANAMKTALLTDGLEYEALGMGMKDAQFIESRKFQVTEIARLFRIPPHMLADLERATFTNIEHQGLEFVVHTMAPWLALWEGAVWRDLIPEQDQEELFAEHLVDALLRGDTKSRYDAYAVARTGGWLNVDEIRDKENMNPLPNGEGQEFLTPLNMAPSGAPPRLTEPPAPVRALLAPPLDRDALVGILDEPWGRVRRREAQVAVKVLQKDRGPTAAAKITEGGLAYATQVLQPVALNVARLLGGAPDALVAATVRIAALEYTDRALSLWGATDADPDHLPERDGHADATRLLVALEHLVAGARAVAAAKEAA